MVVVGSIRDWLRVLALSGLSGLACAQQPLPQGVEGWVDPSLQRQQQERLRERQAIEERARRQEVPALRGDMPETQALPETGESFELRGITFNASVYLDRDELQRIASGYVGRPIRFADLNALLRAVNARYEASGQLTARAIIPAQTLEDGVLRVVLVEARVDSVTWRSPPVRVREDFYTDRVAISPGEVLDSPALMTAIQRFNATTTGPQMTANLAPGTRFGTTRIDLEAIEPGALSGSLFANNYGNVGTGREQVGGSLSWFSPFGLADAANLLLVSSAGSRYASFRYSAPVNRSNGVLYGEFGSNTLTIEEGPLAALNIEGESRSYTLGFDQPWWGSERWLWLTGLGYSQQHSENTLEGLQLSELDSNEVFLRGQMEYRGDTWYLSYEQRLRQASVDNAVTGEGGSYFLTNGEAYLVRPVASRFEFVTRLGWQYAASPEELPASLYYQFGGVSSVRGYDPGIISSPWGVVLNLEAHWRIGERWQPFIFLDAGRAMELGVADVDLQSGGVGLNMNWGRHVSLSLIAASTFKDVVADQDSSQLLAQIVIR